MVDTSTALRAIAAIKGLSGRTYLQLNQFCVILESDIPESTQARDKICQLNNIPLLKNSLQMLPSGEIRKVILDFTDYQRLLEALEDEGLYRAMMEVKDEPALDLDAALAELEKE